MTKRDRIFCFLRFSADAAARSSNYDNRRRWSEMFFIVHFLCTCFIVSAFNCVRNVSRDCLPFDVKKCTNDIKTANVLRTRSTRQAR
jgi:hypothetical protein